MEYENAVESSRTAEVEKHAFELDCISSDLSAAIETSQLIAASCNPHHDIMIPNSTIKTTSCLGIYCSIMCIITIRWIEDEANSNDQRQVLFLPNRRPNPNLFFLAFC
jgi:hypothetical protein